ncbi:MAG: zinc-binding dehydrogenase [Acidobacteria bacterium]|nr:zinc-binding dehydrogenase [Acidobacteriota bacterium]
MLIQVKASGIDGHDLVERSGTMTRNGQSLALQNARDHEIKENGSWVKKRVLILGHEVAGVVTAVGEGVTKFEVGDRVAPSGGSHCGTCDNCRTGLAIRCTSQVPTVHEGYAELCVVHERAVMKIPDNISFEEACIVRCAIGTPLRGMFLEGKEPKFHDNILVLGAGGGLGIHTLQLASLTGGRVIASTTSESKVPLLKQYGADDVILAKDGKFAPQVMALTNGHGADYIIDTVGGTAFNQGGFRALADYGRYVFVGQINDEYARFPVPWLFWREAVLTGCTGGMYEDTLRAFRLMEQGRIKAVISEKFPIEDTSRMHGVLDQRGIVGRAVISFD